MDKWIDKQIGTYVDRNMCIHICIYIHSCIHKRPAMYMGVTRPSVTNKNLKIYDVNLNDNVLFSAFKETTVY